MASRRTLKRIFLPDIGVTDIQNDTSINCEKHNYMFNHTQRGTT